MGRIRRGIKRCVELLAGSELARREVRRACTIEYIVQRRRVFEEYGIDLVLDVGANTGQFVQGLRTFYKGDVISFEPVPAAFDRLAKNAATDSRWKCYNLALGRDNATRKMNVFRETEMSSFLEANEYCARGMGEKVTRTGEGIVSIRRLEDVLDEVVPKFDARRTFLKMDTQGYDVEVFKGLGKKVEHVVALQSEVASIPNYKEMPHWTECMAVYEQAGFFVAGLFPVSWDVCRVIEFDCLMVKARDRARSDV
jgi:FkbM family methyltransferase